MDPTPPRESAASFAARLLAEQLADLEAQVPRARDGHPGAVHRARVAIRRLRSTLGSYAALLTSAAEGDRPDGDRLDGDRLDGDRLDGDRLDGDRLDGELRWLGAALSPARDAHVIRERLLALLDAEPAAFTVGPVRARIRTELDGDEQRGREQGREALESARYHDLVGALAGLAAAVATGVTAAGHPGTATGQPGTTARQAARRALRRDSRRLLRAIEAAESATPEARDDAVHRVRKRAKRLRYAAEPAVDLLGTPAHRLARTARRLQTALGDHQDSVVTAEQVRRLGELARGAGESTETYERLHALEAAHRGAGPGTLGKAARRVRRRRRQLG